MPDFTVEKTAERRLGSTCETCSTHRHDRGFVFLGVNKLPEGDLYVCASCADQIGRAVGGLDPQQAEAFANYIRDLEHRLDTLEAELEHERANKVVSLADVLARERGTAELSVANEKAARRQKAKT